MQQVLAISITYKIYTRYFNKLFIVFIKARKRLKCIQNVYAYYIKRVSIINKKIFKKSKAKEKIAIKRKKRKKNIYTFSL